MYHSKRLVVFMVFLPLFLCGSQENKPAIRHAKAKDLEAVAELSRSIFYNDLKPIILAGLADNPIVQAGGTNAILEDWIAKRNVYAQETCQEGANKEKQLIVFKKEKNVVGICCYEKRQVSDENITYVSFMGVHKKHRRDGIGSSLLFHARQAFKGVDKVELTTLAHANKPVQEFYEKRGFVNKGLTTIDPRAGNTHYLYQLEFKK